MGLASTGWQRLLISATIQSMRPTFRHPVQGRRGRVSAANLILLVIGFLGGGAYNIWRLKFSAGSKQGDTARSLLC